VSGETDRSLHALKQPVLQHEHEPRRCRACPVVIFQFALSPYEEWQKLAWTGRS